MELASDIQMMLVPAVLPTSDKFGTGQYLQASIGYWRRLFRFHPAQPGPAFGAADISGKGLAAALIMSNFQVKPAQSALAETPSGRVDHSAEQSAVFRITNGSRFYHPCSSRVPNRMNVVCAMSMPPDMPLFPGATGDGAAGKDAPSWDVSRSCLNWRWGGRPDARCHDPQLYADG